MFGTFVFKFVVVYLFLAVFLLNGAAVFHADILSFVSVGHVVENTRLVHVDGGARAVHVVYMLCTGASFRMTQV